MAKKGQIFKKYSPEFKLSVILDIRENKLSYSPFIITNCYENVKKL